jgi:hypothetical protein
MTVFLGFVADTIINFGSTVFLGLVADTVKNPGGV